jgi:transcriptional regulator with XRE-family HTH domain
METQEKPLRNTHHGHAIKRIRHTLGIKQDALAIDLGISQAQISNYEHKKVIDEAMLEKFAKALNVAPEVIDELEEDPVTIIIENNSIETNHGRGYVGIDYSINHYNPIEQILELSKEKQALYERMLELEKEKNALLEKLLKERK